MTDSVPFRAYTREELEKMTTVKDLRPLALQLEIANASRMRKSDLIGFILQAQNVRLSKRSEAHVLVNPISLTTKVETTTETNLPCVQESYASNVLEPDPWDDVVAESTTLSKKSRRLDSPALIIILFVWFAVTVFWAIVPLLILTVTGIAVLVRRGAWLLLQTRRRVQSMQPDQRLLKETRLATVG